MVCENSAFPASEISGAQGLSLRSGGSHAPPRSASSRSANSRSASSGGGFNRQSMRSPQEAPRRSAEMQFRLRCYRTPGSASRFIVIVFNRPFGRFIRKR
jgi:hypothetical protein